MGTHLDSFILEGKMIARSVLIGCLLALNLMEMANSQIMCYMGPVGATTGAAVSISGRCTLCVRATAIGTNAGERTFSCLTSGTTCPASSATVNNACCTKDLCGVSLAPQLVVERIMAMIPAFVTICLVKNGM